jgi:hypothetical protein
MEVSTLGLPGGVRSPRSTPDVVWAGYSGLAAGGMLVGVMQAFLLRRHVPRPGIWAVACLGGVLVVGDVVFGVGVANPGAGWLGGIGLFGAVAGALQWRVLRPRMPRAGWWVAASAVGWLVGVPLGEEFGWVALGAVYWMITGTTLVWLLRGGQATAIRPPLGQSLDGPEHPLLHDEIDGCFDETTEVLGKRRRT